MDHLVSIIIPVYKVEKYLDRCIQSVLCQSYDYLEVILVDDGSPDKCPEHCDQYAAIDQRVRVIHKRNGGLSSARNAALDLMRGDYCFFVDSDDFIHTDTITYLMSLAQNFHAGLVQCDKVMGTASSFSSLPDFDKDEPVVFGRYSIFESSMNNVTLCGKLYSSSLWKDVRMPLGKLNEDDYTAWKLYYRADVVVVTKLQLYYNFINDDGISSNLKREPIIAFPIEAYHERISFFDEMGDKHLSDLSKWRYSLYLMLALNNEGLKAEDRIVLKKEFCAIYKDVLRCKSVPFLHKILVMCFFVCPRIVMWARNLKRRIKEL